MVRKRWTRREKGRVTVRSFVLSFVRLFAVVEKREWQCGGKKVMTRGRRSKSRGQVKKKFLSSNRGLKSSVLWHPLLDECVGRIVFLGFNLQQIPSMPERARCYILMLWCWPTKSILSANSGLALSTLVVSCHGGNSMEFRTLDLMVCTWSSSLPENTVQLLWHSNR
jgi:hypothetical protein